MNYLVALIVGAWFTQCLVTAHYEHEAAGISKWAYALLAMLISLFWPIALGVELRYLILGKPKIPKPKLDA